MLCFDILLRTVASLSELHKLEIAPTKLARMTRDDSITVFTAMFRPAMSASSIVTKVCLFYHRLYYLPDSAFVKLCKHTSTDFAQRTSDHEGSLAKRTCSLDCCSLHKPSLFFGTLSRSMTCHEKRSPALRISLPTLLLDVTKNSFEGWLQICQTFAFSLCPL